MNSALASEPRSLPPLTHRDVLAIALPVVLSNVSTPLIGVVDTAIVGRLPDPAYIGAVAVGSLIFTFVFWLFGFLRMGTTGLTAQAFGAQDRDEILSSIGRALLIAAAIGGALILLQWPIRAAAFALIDGSRLVESLAREYFDIRIWAAPATLANYALFGWFIGLGRTKTALVLQLVLNLTNIVLDWLFVMKFGWEVRGVAFGTVIAEYLAAAVGLALVIAHRRELKARWSWVHVLRAERIRQTTAVNRDIMIRSLALIAVYVWFVAQGARQGDVTLAANSVLMHFITVSAYFLDGLAFAAESLVGRAVGAAHRATFVAAVRITTLWAFVLACAAALVIALFGPQFIDLLTTDPATRATARTYLPWIVIGPPLGVWAFQLDGIFIGATRTAQMRSAMVASLFVFLAGWWLLTPLGNHGLWASLYVHYFARIGSLAYFFPALLRSIKNDGKGSGVDAADVKVPGTQ
jgi:MATE family multidrug resistance protein